MIRLRVGILFGLLCGCSVRGVEEVAQGTAVPANQLIVPGERVGDWVIGEDSLASILGHDTTDARNRLAEQGFYFEFYRGGTLTGVTVTNPGYQTRDGLRVGSNASAVELFLGTSQSRRVEEKHGKFAIAALVYDGIVFVLNDDVVVAIRVGTCGDAQPNQSTATVAGPTSRCIRTGLRPAVDRATR